MSGATVFQSAPGFGFCGLRCGPSGLWEYAIVSDVRRYFYAKVVRRFENSQVIMTIFVGRVIGMLVWGLGTCPRFGRGRKNRSNWFNADWGNRNVEVRGEGRIRIISKGWIHCKVLRELWCVAVAELF